MPNTDQRISGLAGAIYLAGTKVAAKSQFTFSRARDTFEVTSFGDSNKTYVAGLPDVSGTFTGFLDSSGDLLLTNAGSATPVSIALWAVDGSTEIAHGSGYVDCVVTVPVNGAASVTGNFRASNSWQIDL